MDQSARHALIDPLWDTIRYQLETVKRSVTSELRNYPQPHITPAITNAVRR